MSLDKTTLGKLRKLEKLFDTKDLKYSNLDNSEIVNKAYNLLIKDKYEDQSNLDGEELFYGIYYQFKDDFDNMIIYYQPLIDDFSKAAIYNLARYYANCDDSKNLIKYYELAAYNPTGVDSDALFNLGNYYFSISNLEKCMQFYEEAINHKNTNAMCAMGKLYKIKNKIEKAKDYYLMACEFDDVKSMIDLGTIYKEEKDYDKMLKYYIMAFNEGNYKIVYRIIRYYQKQKDLDNIIKYCKLALERKNDETVVNYLAYYYKKHGFNNELLKLYKDCGFKDKFSQNLKNFLEEEYDNKKSYEYLWDYIHSEELYDFYPVYFKLLNDKKNLSV